MSDDRLVWAEAAAFDGHGAEVAERVRVRVRMIPDAGVPGFSDAHVLARASLTLNRDCSEVTAMLIVAGLSPAPMGKLYDMPKDSVINVDPPNGAGA